MISLPDKGLKFRSERLIRLQNGHKVEFHDRVGWDIGGFLFKPTMHVNHRVYRPDDVTESLQAFEFEPLAALCFIHFHLHIVVDIVCATAEYQHHRANE